MTWVNSDARIVLWGGSGAFFQNDIAAFNPVTSTWATYESASNCPGNTAFAPPNGSDENGVVFDPIADRLWIYNGGSGYRCATTQAVGRTAGAGTTTTSIVDPTLGSTVNDFYKDWTIRAPNGAKARVNAYVASTKTLTLSVALGVGPASAYDLYVDFGDGTWNYDLATGQYHKLEFRHWGYSGYLPPARKSPGFAANGVRAIMFGGLDYDNGTYALDFAAGSYSIAIPQGLSSSPAARGQIQNQFVYDSAHDRFVLFGGRCFDPGRCSYPNMLDDTWVYDAGANTWTEVTPAVRPPARNQAQMYFDAGNGVVVLYGGSGNGGTLFNDLWTFDVGTLTWTQQTMPPANPGGIFLGQVAYAPTTGCGYVVYGLKSGATASGNTWRLCLVPVGGNQAPVAYFTATPSTTAVGSAIAMSAAGSSDSDGSIVNYAWSFGDGTNASGVSVSKTYATAGLYTVTLTVTDNGGATNTTTRAVTITSVNQPPVANFTVAPSPTTTGTPIAMSGATSFDPDGSIAGYFWDFGDGTTGTGVTVSKSYSVAGTYTIRLTVTDNGGLSATTTAAVTVTATGGGASSVWVEDALPTGAIAGGSESFAWITTNPAPYSGVRAHQSGIAAGIHQHYFVNATPVLAIGVGDSLFTYVYLDPANPPREVMLQFYDGSWEHRAYWGANLIPWAARGGVSGRYMGPLPVAGQWVRLDVTAAQVGLEGRTLNGIAYTLYDGRATWDMTGKVSGSTSNQPPIASFTANPATASTGTPIALSAAGSSDPDGSITTYAWNFGDGTSGNGVAATKSYAAAGTYTVTLTVADNGGATSSTTRVVTIFLPNQPPIASFTATPATASTGTPIALSAAGSSDPDGSITTYAWNFGDGTSGNGVAATKSYAAAGTYTVTLTVADNGGATSSTTRVVTIFLPNQPPIASFTATPATASTGTPIALSAAGSSDPDGSITTYAWNFGDGTSGNGVAATKSYAAAGTYTVTLTVTDNGGATAAANRSVTITAATGGTSTVWVDDAVPTGASTGGNEGFVWVSANPVPFSGSKAHQSALAAGTHQHYFANARTKLVPATGDTLFAYVYLDPVNPPRQVMLQWYDGSWEHRAYWGPSLIPWGGGGGVGGRYIGALPAVGQWVRLEVPAALVGLEGRAINGMAFSLFDGRATWDNAGKRTP